MKTRRRSRKNLLGRLSDMIAPSPTAGRINPPRLVERLEDRIAPAAIISATLTDNTGSPVAAGGTIHYTETVSNSAVIGAGNEALLLQITHGLDPNLTIVPGSLNISPLAFDDNFTAIGNTQLFVNGTGAITGTTPSRGMVGNILANDLEFANDQGVMDTFTLTTTGTFTTSGGGSVTVNSDGTFVYTPGAGFTGNDTFTYTIRDDGIDGIAGNADDLTGTGTVNIAVANKVWYVDSAAGTNGDGRSNTPFNTLASVTGATGLDAAGDIIYLHSSATDYTGGMGLLANQTLIGGGSALVVAGYTLKNAGAAPQIVNSGGNGVTLNSGNTLTGFKVGTTSGTGILGASVGALTVDNVLINTTGAALSLTSGSFSGTGFTSVTGKSILLNGITSTGTINLGSGALSNNSGDIFSVVNGATAGITYTGSITAASGAGHSVSITGKTGGTVALSGAISDSGTGLLFSSNTGATINLTGGVVASTGANKAFSATGGGTINVTGSSNTLTTTSGTALEIVNTTIGTSGVTFQSISSNGAAKGLILNNTGTGAFTLTGTGTTDNSGGTIQNASTRGVEIINASNISISNLRLINASTTDGTVDDLTTTTSNAAISLNTVSSITLTNVDISGTNQQGINGNTVSGFSFINGTITGAGDGVEEGAIKMRGLTGVATISGSDFSFSAAETLEIVNTTGSLTLNVNNSTFRDTQSSGVGGTGIQLRNSGTATGIVNVTNSSFLRIRTVGINVQALGNSLADVDISTSTLDPGTGTMIGIDLAADNSATLKFNIQNNTKIWSRNGPAVNIFGDNNAVVDGRINNNPDIRVLSNVAGSQVGSAVRANLNKSSVGRLEVKSNVINIGSDDSGIDISAIGETTNTAGGTVDATITGNNITIGNTSAYGIVLIAASNAGDFNKLTANVQNNAVTRGPTSIVSFRARAVSSNGAIALEGFTTSVENTWNIRGNTPASSGGSEVSSGGSGTFGAGTATLPTNAALDADPLLFAPTDPTSETPTPPTVEQPPIDPGSGTVTTPVLADDGLLTQAELNELVQAALQRWEAAGLTPQQMAMLRATTFDVADYQGRILGESTPGHVTLDLNGASMGWFVDTTPGEDSEFDGSNQYVNGHLDAFTVVLHEMGHQLGLKDTYNVAEHGDLMYGYLHLGERRLPTAHQADGATPGTDTTPDFAFSPIVIGTLPPQKTLTLNFDAKIANNITATSVSTQGTITGTSISTTTDDPDVAGANNPTVTQIDLPDVSVAVSSAVTENSGGTLTYTFTRTGPNDFTRTINFSIGGSATFTTDYTQSGAATFNGTTGTVTFASGSNTATVTLTPVGDTTVELSETILLTVTGGTGYDIGTPNAATGTITNDDSATVSVSAATISEGNAGTSNLAFTVSLTNPVDVDTTVSFSTADLTAIAGSDYFAQSGVTVTILAGQTSATRNVVINGDTTVELNETFTGTISNASASTRAVTLSATTSATATINNDDSATVSISGGTVVEGHTGTANLPYTITLSNPVDTAVTVNFSTADGTATIVDSDYVAQSGVLVTIPAGSTSVTQNVVVNGDSKFESNETVAGSIGNLSAGGRSVTLGTSSADGTITNDDAQITLSVSPSSIVEDAAGVMTYTFTRTGATAGGLTVNFTVGTGAGAATFNTDYSQSGAATFTASTGSITFAPGATTATITIDPTADTTAEGDETVALTLSAGTGYSLGSPSVATGTILDDDTKISLSVSPGSITEGTGTLGYTFTRTGDTALPVTVNFSYSGTAGFTADYTQSGAATFGSGVGTITIPAGQSSAMITLTSVNDTIVEGSETAAFQITAGTGYGIDTISSATGTINDNDTAVIQLVSGTSSPGEAGGTHNVGVQLVITANGVAGSGTLGKDVSVNLQDLLTGTATGAGNDYTYTGPSTLTFTSGSGGSTQNAVVTLVNDTKVEGSETINLQLNTLSDSFNGQVTLGATTAHTVTVTDNDFATISLTSASSSVGEATASQNIGVVLTITANGVAGTGTLDRQLTVNLSDLLTGTASSLNDYSYSTPQTVTFNVGDTNSTLKNVAVGITNDTRVEGNETINFSLGSLSSTLNGQASLGATTAHTLTINDNDTATLVFTGATGSVGEATASQNVGVQLLITANGVAGTGTLDRTVTVNVQDLLTGTATAGGSDYTFTTPQTLTFNAGDASGTTKNTAVTIVNDTRLEGSETINFGLNTLSDGSGGQVTLGATTSHALTITDNETATISLSGGGTVGENSGSTNLTATLTITANGVAGTGTLDRAVSVNIAQGTGTATGGGTDFGFSSPQTITFAVGASSGSQNSAVTIIDDTIVEGSEAMSFTLGSLVDGSGTQVSLGTTSTSLTINDNDTATISLSPITSTSESGGPLLVQTVLTITANGVVGTGTLSKAVSVNLQDLLTGSATAGGSDYTFTTPQTLTFASGAASGTQSVFVTLTNDTRVEGNETINFALNTLTDTIGGQLSLGTTAQTATITDNDFATISLVSATNSVGEGTATQNVGVILTITANGVAGSGTLDRTLTVNLSDLLTGTATGAGVDYTYSSPQTVTFNVGDAFNTTKNVSIGITNDQRVEGSETIDLSLGSLSSTLNGQASLGSTTAHTLTINDNDTATISVATSSSIGEGAGTHNVGVTLTINASGTGPVGLDKAVSVNLSDLLTGTATGGGSDYTFTSPQTITFNVGDTTGTKNVALTLVDDTRVEGSESINLQLGSLTDGTGGQVTLGSGQAHTVTINDNDTATISLSGGGSFGEASGSHDLTATLVITANGTPGTGTLERAISVDLGEGSGGATGGGSDYTFTGQTLTFASGAASGDTKTVAVGIVDDTRVEGIESRAFTLTNLVSGAASQASIGTANTFVSITDNDTAKVVFVSGSSTTSEGAGTSNVGVQLIITGNGVEGTGSLERPVSVNVINAGTGSATGGGVDYTYTSPQTVTFAAGSVSGTQDVVVGIVNDSVAEGSETINFTLGNLSDGSEGQVSLGAITSHTKTIVDNDVDLRVTKTAEVSSVVAGSGAGNLVYTITVHNDGLTDATGVVLGEDLTLPAGATIVSVTPSQGSYATTTGPDGSWTLGTLAAGGSATLTVTLTVGSSTAAGTGIISDTASITSATEDLINTANDSASLSTDVTRSVDLVISKTDNKTVALPGDVLSYAVAVNNAGVSDANGVVLTETVPLGTTFNSAVSTAGWTAQGGGVYTFNLGTVAGSGNHAPVTFAVTVNSPAVAGQDTIVNTATVLDDGTTTLTPAHLTTTDTDTLNAAPDLVVTKTQTGLPSAVRGGTITYTLTYQNVGNQNAAGVVLTETLPANTTFQSSSASWTQTSPGVYQFMVGNLPAGGTAQTITFVVHVNDTLPAGNNPFINTVTLTDNDLNGTDPTPANDTASTTTPLYQGIYVVSQGVALPKKGGPANVLVYDVATNTQLFQIPAYEATYRDSVRVAVGDINGDGYDDIITSTRTGTGRVRVFDGVTGVQFTGTFAQIDAFDGKKEKGAFVASGDVTGDGHDDLVIGSALGGGTVKIYDGITGAMVTSYKPFGNSFKGGVKVAVGDVDGDGTDDVIVGQGYKGATVRVLDGASQTQLQQFKVGPNSYKGGVTVAAGDVDGDGKADIITGRNTGKPSQVEVFKGMTSAILGSPIVPFGPKYNLGVRVAAADVNFDGIADIIVGSGGKNNSLVKFYDGVTHNEITARSFSAFPAYPNSALFVAGSSPVPTVPGIIPPP